MLNSILCNYSDACILVKETIPTAQTATVNNANKKVIFKISAPFTDYINKINNTQIDNAKDVDVVITMYNLKGYSGNHHQDVYGKFT